MFTRRERGRKRSKIGHGDEEVQTSSYKKRKSQGCGIQHREYSGYFIITSVYNL